MNDLLSKERLEKIKEMATDAAKGYGAKWLSALVGGKDGNYNAITSDQINDVVVRANDNKRESAWLCDYLEEVSPATVISLIDELLQRRAAAEKAPVAWLVGEGILYNHDTVEAYAKRSGLPVKPLYTSPPLPVVPDKRQSTSLFDEWFKSVEAGDDENWQEPKYLSKEWDAYLGRMQLARGAWNAAMKESGAPVEGE